MSQVAPFPETDAAEQVAADITNEAPAEPKVPTTVEELDQEYFRFFDLRVYTTVLATQGFEEAKCFYYQDLGEKNGFAKFEKGEEAPILCEIEVVDVPATHAKIEASKARLAAKHARKVCRVAPDLKKNDSDSRQVRRRKEKLRETYKPPSEHVGFNRALRRGFLKRMSRSMRLALTKQLKEKKKPESVENKFTELLDTSTEV